MTNLQKLAHACTVLKALTNQMCEDAMFDIPSFKGDTKTGYVKNLHNLIELLKEPHDPESKKVKQPHPDSPVLARYLYESIKNRKPNLKTPSITQWNTDIDKIIRIDKRTVGQIRELIDWTAQDKFWSTNILSPASLRRNLDKLELQMWNDFTWQHNKLQRREVVGLSMKEKYFKEQENEDQSSNG